MLTVPTSAPHRLVRTGAAALLLVAGVAAGALPAAAASVATPTGLQVTGSAKTAIALDWDSVPGAPRYRVAVSTHANMSHAKFRRFTASEGEVDGLRAKTTYYVKVRAITDDGANLSPYTPATKVKTPSSSGHTYLSPDGLTVSTGSTTAQLGWATRAAGVRYRVQYATDQSMTGATSVTAGSTQLSVSGLDGSTRYWFRARVVSASGKSRSPYSAPVQATTQEAPVVSDAAPLRVASYNIRCANCYAGLTDELPWSGRRNAVVATIKHQDLDVLGVEEASQGWLKRSDGSSIDLSQFEDLANRLGDPWTLTNRKRNNCVKDTTPTHCVYADQGASQGTRILYNADRIEMLRSGSALLPSIDSTNNARYVAWAVLHQRSTGKDFFFAATHLEFSKDVAGSDKYYDLRKQQAKAVLATIRSENTDDLPVIMVGDFNSSRFADPTNAPYDVLTGGGLVDPLGGAYGTTRTAPGATAEVRKNNWLSSFNGFKRQAVRHQGWINGSYIDYILTSHLRVSEWETVADVDSSDRFVGVIPSDHNMIRATVHLA